MASAQEDISAFVRQMPKVELHAHLHGSIRNNTLREFVEAELGGSSDLVEKTLMTKRLSSQTGERTLSDCFSIFDIIHKVVVRREYIERIVQELIVDLSEQNVIYAEIRTTPRPIPECGLDKYGYTATVIESIQKFTSESSPTVKLILSIDRSDSVENAWDTLSLYLTVKKDCRLGSVLVGLDFSGNPTKQSFCTFLPVFERAKLENIKITVHYAEVFDKEDAINILSFKPNRLGHACCMTPDLLRSTIELGIPIEVCPTSNMMTRPEIVTFHDHPVQDFLECGHPVSICTDDQGVFCTDLSSELLHICSAFNLSKIQLSDMQLKAITFIFAEKDVKTQLKGKVNSFIQPMTPLDPKQEEQ